MKIIGEVTFETAIRDNQTPEETVAEYIKNIPVEGCTLEVKGTVTQIFESDFEFMLFVKAEVDAKDEDTASEIVENCLFYELDCQCTIIELEES